MEYEPARTFLKDSGITSFTESCDFAFKTLPYPYREGAAICIFEEWETLEGRKPSKRAYEVLHRTKQSGWSFDLRPAQCKAYDDLQNRLTFRERKRIEDQVSAEKSGQEAEISKIFAECRSLQELYDRASPFGVVGLRQAARHFSFESGEEPEEMMEHRWTAVTQGDPDLPQRFVRILRASYDRFG